MRRSLIALAVLLMLAVAAWLLGRPRGRPARDAIRTQVVVGHVFNDDGPVSRAVVRIRGSRESVQTDDSGRFELATAEGHPGQPQTGAAGSLTSGPLSSGSPSSGPPSSGPPSSGIVTSGTLTAWKEGHFIQGADRGRDLHLRKLPTDDNPAYAWIDPTPDSADAERCGNCHQQIFAEWQASAHAHSVHNRRFRGLFEGTDWHGRPHSGWNLQAEYPGGIEVCASCHAPGLDFEGGASGDLRRFLRPDTDSPDAGGSGPTGGSRATGGDDAPGARPGADAGEGAGSREVVAAQGVHCDFCHKIQDLSGGAIGLAHGRFGFKLLRPRKGQLFFGPLDDVDRGEETFSPLQRESRYCAACHEGTVFGIHVYGTYSEWLESPAAQAGRTCQSCHMAPTGRMTNFAPNAGGIERDPQTLASHTLFPGGQLQMLQRCLEVDSNAVREGDVVQCSVGIVPRDVGHRVPTGFIDRHLLLVVEAFDAGGRAVFPAAGETLPETAGLLAGLPGRLFGRVLVGENGDSPAPFWRATSSLPDTRLVPERREVATWNFPASATRVRIRLLYRRFWPAVAANKNWPDDTLVVVDRMTAVVEVSSATCD